MEKMIRQSDIENYCAALQGEERSPGTIAKYRRDIMAFSQWVGGIAVSKELSSNWKGYLLERHYAPRTINSMLAALNGFFCFMGWEIRVKFLKIQNQIFRDERRELTRAEYSRLITAAQNRGKERLMLIMETLCATGIRISELRYVTVSAVQNGRAVVSLKGKIRTVLLPEKLRRKLLKYAKKKKITSGEIFLTKSGRPVSRRQIWYEMKQLCLKAGILSSKVFPHNFRHLFATAFYSACKDIVRLADVLGHSSIETTRIYLAISGAEQARQIERLDLVL